MKLKLALLAATLIATPAFAQGPAPGNDTVLLVIEKGVMMNVMGTEGEMEFKADGTWSGFGGAASGTYKVDGDKICTTSDLGEGCASYPAGKKSGEQFTITLGELGEVPVTIR